MPLSFEEFKGLRDKGLSIDQINRFESGQIPATLKAPQTPEQAQNTMNEGQEADNFLQKSTLGQVFSPQFAKEVPRATASVLLKNPLKFLASAAEVPQTLAAGKATQTEYKAPFVGSFKSFQSEAETRAGRIIDDKDPLYYALAPFAEVPLAAAEFVQLGRFGLATTRVAGRAIGAVGKGIFKIPFTPTAQEAPLVQAYKANVPFFTRLKLALQGTPSPQKPITAGETALKQTGAVGTQTGIGIRSKRAASTIWKEVIDPKLSQIKDKVDMPSFFSQLQKTIIKDNPELARQKDLLTALESLKKDYKGVGKVSYEDLQRFKEGWSKFIPEKAFKGQPISGAFNDLKNIARSQAREMIISKLGKWSKEAYFDYGNLKRLTEMGQKASQGGIVPTGGSFTGISAIYHTAITPVATILGKVIYKTGQGVEFVGKTGAKTLGELFRGL